jgi:hypothetical protein
MLDFKKLLQEQSGSNTMITSKCRYTRNIREASNSRVANNSRDATTTGMPISAGTVRNVGIASRR